jgi:hypothetical protein
MGHSRLGDLPKTRHWKKVIEALSDPDASMEKITYWATKAAKDILLQSANYEGLSHCFWLYTNIAQASRSEDFCKSLNSLGIKISRDDTGINILQKIYNAASEQLSSKGKISTLDRLALDSFHKNIHQTITQESHNLFGCNIDTIQNALKKYSTNKQVAELSRNYFSEYTYKTLSHAFEKQIVNSIDKDGKFKNSSDVNEFDRRLKTYCWETSKILEDFSGGWYGKHGYKKDIHDPAVTKRFTRHSLNKLLSEITRESY